MSKQYKVVMTRTYTTTFEVEAETPAEAIRKVNELGEQKYVAESEQNEVDEHIELVITPSYDWVVRDREAGNIIDYFETEKEAKDYVFECEEDDVREGVFTENFYEVVCYFPSNPMK